MNKLILAFAFALGLAGTSYAGGLVGGGAYRSFFNSSGTVFTGGGKVLGVICSTPAAAAFNTLYFQVFDTAPAQNSGFLTPGGVLPAIVGSTQTVTPAVMIATSSVLGNPSTLTLLDLSNFGGIHVNNGAYFWYSLATSGPTIGCTVVWGREDRDE